MNIKTYALLDENGIPQAFYNDDLYPPVTEPIMEEHPDETWMPLEGQTEDDRPIISIKVGETYLSRNENIPEDAIEITEDQWHEFLDNPGKRKWNGTALEEYSPEIDMSLLRENAFKQAMAYGNSITDSIIGTYSDVEARTWVLQEDEARRILAGETLPSYALLPFLAADKGQTNAEYAQAIVTKANNYKQIVRAGVLLRRGAEQLKSPTLDTPEKLDSARMQLRSIADQKKAQLIPGS